MISSVGSALSQCSHPTGINCRWNPDPCNSCCVDCDDCVFTFYCYTSSCAVIAECESFSRICYTWTYNGNTTTVCNNTSGTSSPLYFAFEIDFVGLVTIEIYDINNNLKCDVGYFYNCL